MREAPSPALPRDPLTKRALELDALAAILPMDRRDRLAEILTDDDVATLKHLAKEGMGENSLRALASDLAYLEAWALASTGTPLPWPAPEALALKFVAHHLWDPARRDSDPGHGMPDTIAAVLRAEGLLRSDGPHAPATVRRRLSSWATLHHWKGAAGAFKSPALPFGDPPRGARHSPAADPEEPKSGDGGCARKAPRDVHLRSACRCARRGAASRRFRVGRAAAQRSRGTARRAAHRGGAGSRRPLRSQYLQAALSIDPAWPHQDHRDRYGRKGVSGRASGRGAAGMAGPGRYWERAGVSSDRSMGRFGRQGADAAIGERDSEAPDRFGRAQPQGVFCAWAAGRLSDRGGAARGFVAGGDAAVATSLGAAGSELLQ
jgi:hypothetical protein